MLQFLKSLPGIMFYRDQVLLPNLYTIWSHYVARYPNCTALFIAYWFIYLYLIITTLCYFILCYMLLTIMLHVITYNLILIRFFVAQMCFFISHTNFRSPFLRAFYFPTSVRDYT